MRVSKRFCAALLCAVIAVGALTACRSKKPTYVGFYTLHILFRYSEEQRAAIDERTNDEMTEEQLIAVYDEVALQTTTDRSGIVRPVFGMGGVYNEISAAMYALSGQAALDVFESYMLTYSEDSTDYEDGIYVPLEGESWLVAAYEQTARSLYNHETPAASVGNAIANNRLAFCASEYGVHIIIINGLATVHPDYYSE